MTVNHRGPAWPVRASTMVVVLLVSACAASAAGGSAHRSSPSLGANRQVMHWAKLPGAIPPTAPPAVVPVPVGPVDRVLLSGDGADDYRVEVPGDQLVVTAPPTNQSGNLRVIYVPQQQPESVDQMTCATWSGQHGGSVQEGIAVRVHEGGDGTGQAITVTKNIWAFSSWVLNVHLWTGGVRWARQQAAQLDFKPAVVRDGAVKYLPWRVCTRVMGLVMQVKLWLADQAEPSWQDPQYVRSVDLPLGWANPGRPGWYAGHLEPGDFLAYGSIRALEQP